MAPRECAFRPTVVADPALGSTAQPHGYPHTHITKYVLAQHYFTVPLQTQEDSYYGSERRDDAHVVRERAIRVRGGLRDGPGGGPRTHRRDKRPLLAIDFGHAVWPEHVRAADDGKRRGAIRA
jgi:hypothetical protein